MSESESLSFDDAEAMAEAWSDRTEIQTMVASTTEVFAKWASPELLSRFRQQMMAVVQQAFIEGVSAQQDRAIQHTLEPVAWPSREGVARALGKRRGHPNPWADDFSAADDVLALFQPLAALSHGGEADNQKETK